ncbi:MAG: sodium:solute symporter, partial [Bacteroidota bacterium]
PDGTPKEYVRLSFLVSIVVVIIGTLFGIFGGSLNNIIDWLVSALYGGYTAANLIKWYWWRFNGYGYFWGMVGGILAAMFLPQLLPELTALEAFPINLAISVVGCLLGSLLTPPDDEETLKQFYLKTRPWGFWQPIHNKLLLDYPNLESNKNFGRDMLNVAVGILWQTSLTALPIFLVVQDFNKMGITAIVVAVTTLILKFNWYDKLEDYPLEVASKEN